MEEPALSTGAVRGHRELMATTSLLSE